jgi:hypothetical protein
MSILPQLESELLKAHQRRRPRRRIDIRGAAAVAVGVAVVVAVVVAIAGAGHRRAAVAVRPSVAPPGAAVVAHHINGEVLHIGDGSLYLGQPTSTGMNLVHLDSTTGAVICTVGFAGQIEHVLPAYGALWVTTAGQPQLWKIDPNSGDLLAATLTLPGSYDYEGDTGALSATGGSVWVGTGHDLIRVSPETATIKSVTRFPGASGIKVAANSSHLVVSAGARVQLRDPVTGALRASSGSLAAENRLAPQPSFGGVAGDGVWISFAIGGPRGYIERLDLRTMKPVPATIVYGTGGMQAQVTDGILFVTQTGGGAARNYCADPITGRPRLTLPFLSSAPFRGANSRDLYFGSQNLLRAAIDPRCR